MIRASFVIPDFKGLRRQLDRTVASACLRVARAAPRLQRDQIRKRATPDGKPQRANAPTTVARKGHNHQLIDEFRVLITPARYKVAKLPNGASVAIPLGYRQALRRHRQLGYDYWRVGDALRRITAETLKKALDRFEAQSLGRVISARAGGG